MEYAVKYSAEMCIKLGSRGEQKLVSSLKWPKLSWKQQSSPRSSLVSPIDKSPEAGH